MGGQVIHIWSEIERSADHLIRMITASRSKIELIESEMIDRMAVVSAEGQRNLTAARRIVGALERRLDKLNNHLGSGAPSDITAAFKLLGSPLQVPNDCVNKLISEASMEPIAVEDIEPTLNRLLLAITPQRKRQLF
ncbi:MAG: hypothetical protein U0136_19910 [Bdellovibrionota bacterium]